MAVQIIRRRSFVLASSALLLASGAVPVGASGGKAVTLGALKFTSSGPVFLALERGYFAEEGIDATITFFQDAPSVAAATAAGGVSFGITALTAAFYNLASQGRLQIIAGQSQEKPGHSGNLILVQQGSYAAGHTTLDKLFELPFGLTQLGSPSHYMLGQLAEISGFPVKDLNIRSFQTLPNLVAALKSGYVDWAIIAPPISTDLITAGAVVSIGPFSDFGSYQFGAAFASNDLLAADPDLAQAFLRAYRKGLQDYAQIVAHPDTAEARSAAAAVGHYVYPDLPAEKAAGLVLASALYVDPDGQLDVEDIARQIKWYLDNGMVKTGPNIDQILRLDLTDWP
ncbi:MAG: ABC transporter substrate-binding protein [bacterium]